MLKQPLKNQVRKTLIHQQFDAIPFTEAAFKQLETDLQELIVKRKEVIIRLNTAREMGDLSENGAYTYAKFELGDIGRKMRKLKHLLANGVVVKQATNSNIVQFGSTVTVQTGTKTFTYTLVSLHESNPMEGKLSIESPIGQALLNKKVADVVKVTTPAGITEYTITAVKN